METADSEADSRRLVRDLPARRRSSSATAARVLRCERAKTDPRFPRYPPLPVRACIGYDEKCMHTHPARAAEARRSLDDICRPQR